MSAFSDVRRNPALSAQSGPPGKKVQMHEMDDEKSSRAVPGSVMAKEENHFYKDSRA